jgi:hypothetical protein
MNTSGMILEKVNRGIPLTNEEVTFGEHYFGKLSDQLYELGDVFKLSADEARRVNRTLNAYRLNRELDPFIG